MPERLKTHDAVMRVIGLTLENLRYAFADNHGLGDEIPRHRVQHRGGIDIALDGFNDDNCAALAWVNVLRRFPTNGDGFPNEVPFIGDTCGRLSGLTIQVGIARCASLPDDDGFMPSGADLEHEALVLLDDASRLDAVLCRVGKDLANQDVVATYALHGGEPVGPEGGIVSWVQTASFLFT